MIRPIVLIIFLYPIHAQMFSQEHCIKTIHQEQSEYYAKLRISSRSAFDSLHQFAFPTEGSLTKDYSLVKRVFGYFPYWAGNNYLNYQWDLLSDLCYFSYEVDPVSGNPLTIHDWDSSPAIDSAYSNNVKVHLCVTLFSGHYSFFESQVAQQTLIENIISLVQSRGAHGVNMDIEALPSSIGDLFTDFMIDLNVQMSEAIPNAELSIAVPAVNWSGTFDIAALNPLVDFFMVMGYDYYWNGSPEAGAVSPLFSITGYYDYSFSKTISYYQSQGVSNDRIIMGVPYYARQWPTQDQFAPSATNGYGTAYTYRYIKTNFSGYYSSENLHLEPNSFSPYYSYQNNGWTQCFVDNVYSMGRKYDQIIRRGLSGIGIWALGYDDGYTELWELIAEKFTDSSIPVCVDTIFDTGGPAFNYYDNESYTFTVITPENTNTYLSFSYLYLEEGYDSLWIFDGPDNTSPLIGKFSGDSIPLLIAASGNFLTLQFQSDNGINQTGWRAVYDTLPVSSTGELALKRKMEVIPNPTKNMVTIIPSIVNLHKGVYKELILKVFDVSGKRLFEKYILQKEPSIFINTEDWNSGTYIIVLFGDGNVIGEEKVIVQ